MMVASVNTNLQSERSHLSRNESESCKVSAFHGWCNSFFYSVFNIPFESNASIKPKKIFFTRYKENNIRNIFRVSTFQQLFPNMAIFSTVVISRLVTQSLHVQTHSLLRIERFDKTKRKYILHNEENICNIFVY